MGLINLPAIVQKIKVDTSDMKRAEATATGLGDTIDKETGKSDAAMQALEKRQKAVAQSTGAVTEEIKKSASEFSNQTKALKDNANTFDEVKKSNDGAGASTEKLSGIINDFNTKTKNLTTGIRESTKAIGENTKEVDTNSKTYTRHRKSTDDAGGGFDNLVKKVKGAGSSFGELGGLLGGLKIPALVAGASAAVTGIAALGAAAGAVVAQFGPMVGVVGAAAPALLAVKSSVSVVTGAFKELEKTDKTGTIKSLQGIKTAAAAAAAPGILSALKSLSPAIEIVRKGYVNLGQTLGGAFADNASQLSKNTVFMNNLGTVMSNNTRLAETFADSLQPIARIFVNITKAAGPMAQSFVDDFTNGANSIAKMTDNTGKLESFFAKAETTARRFVGSTIDIGIAIKNTFSIGAKAIGIDFVGGLEDGARKMKEFTQSAEGAAKIKKFFEDAGPVIRETGLLIKDVAKLLVGLGKDQNLAPFIKQIREEMLPALQRLLDGVGADVLPAVGKLATAFLDLTGALPFSPLVETAGALAEVASAAAKLIGAVPGLGELVATLLLMKTASKGISIISNATGITSLVTSLKGIGAAGTAGAKGLGGIIQGLRGATAEGATFSNKIGGFLKTAFTGGIESAKTLGSGIKTGLQAGFTALKDLGPKAKVAGSAIATNLKSGVSTAATAMASLGSSAKTAAVAMASAAASGAKAAWAGIATALGPVITGLKGAAVAAKAFTLSLLTNPIFLIITAIIALGAALVALYKNNETFRNFVNAAWEKIKSVISTVVDWLVNTAWPFIQKVWTNLSTEAQILWNIVKTAWDGIWAAVEFAVNMITTILNGVSKFWQDVIVNNWNAIKEITTTVWNAISSFLSTVWNGIVTYVTTYVETVKTVISTAWTVISTVTSTVWNSIMTILNGIWMSIQAIIQTAVSIVKTIIETAWNAIKIVITTAMNVIKTIIETGWNLVKTVVTTVINVIKAILTGHFGEIPGIIGKGMDSAKKIVGDAWNSIKKSVGDAISGLLSLVSALPGKIVSALGNLGNLLFNAGKQVVQGLINGIQSMFGALQSKASELAGKVAGALPGSPVKFGPLRVLNRGYAGKQIVKMLQEGMNNAQALKVPGLDTIAKFPAQTAMSNFPRQGGPVGQRPSTSAVDNSRTYNVKIYETQGPSTASSVTDRLRLLDVTL